MVFPLAHTGGMDLAVAFSRVLRIAWRMFLGVLRMVWRICDLPVRVLIPARYPGLRALFTGVLFVAAIVLVDVALTGGPPQP